MKNHISVCYILSVSSVVFAINLGFSAKVFGQISDGSDSPKDIAKNTTEAAIEVVKPLQKSPELERILKLVEKSKLHHENYLKKVVSGDVKPWQELIDNQAEMLKQVEDLSVKYQGFLDAKRLDMRPAVIENAASQLRTVLKLIGPYLQNADYLPVDQSITKQEATFIEDTLFADKGPAALPKDLKEERNTLKLSGATSSYTLIHLPCPIILKTVPNATIYLTTGTGGVFSNNLSVQVITADKSGNATTYWKSPGDSIGPATVLIESPQTINHITLDINVVKPLLINIPDAEQFNQLQKIKLPQLNK